jgi:hypothetical protein
MPILGVIASSRLTAEPDTGAMFPLQVVTVGAAGATEINFTNIPSTYSHLQLRCIARGTTGSIQVNARFNSDTGSNYTEHDLLGDGSSASAYGAGNITWIPLGGVATAADTFAAYIIDVLDYSNTNKFKTVRALRGFDSNGSGNLGLFSGLWRSTSAISSITLVANTGNFTQNSQFALYAIKGA